MNPNAARVTTLGLRPDAQIRECLPTGIASLDALAGGFPRGAIAEILGQVTSQAGPRATMSSGDPSHDNPGYETAHLGFRRVHLQH